MSFFIVGGESVALVPGNVSLDLLRCDSMLADLTDPDPVGSIKYVLIYRMLLEIFMLMGKGKDRRYEWETTARPRDRGLL
jgi:hypothetical protein